MRKVISLMLIVCICISLCACANTKKTIEENPPEETVGEELSEENYNENKFASDIENKSLKLCDKYLYTFENQMATASYQGISHYIKQLTALNIDNVYVDKLFSAFSLIEANNLTDLENDLLQLVPMVMFFHEHYSMEESNITNVWSVGYDDAGNANNMLPQNARILWIKDELNSNSTIGFIAYDYDGVTLYDYGYFNEDAMVCLSGIEENSLSGKCAYTESKYLFLSPELHSIVKAADGMDYSLISTEKVDTVLDLGTELYEILMLYRDGVYWADIQTERAEKLEEQKHAEEAKNAEPKIGMTKSEVLNGAWGSPDKKNIDEYAWGTEEQWVYNDKGYVYFKDGIVTAVQRRG